MFRPIFFISLLILFTFTILFSNFAEAQIHPLPTTSVFQNENQKICFFSTSLDIVSLNGIVNQSSEIQTLIEASATYLSNITNMKITTGGTSPCIVDYESIILGDSMDGPEDDDDWIAKTEIVLDEDTDELLFKIITFDTDLIHPFKSSGDCVAPTNYNLQQTANHEFGHFVGFKHPDVDASALPDETTVMGLTCNPNWAVFSESDIDQIDELYLMPFWLVQIADWWSTDEIADYEYLHNINFMVEAALLPGVNTTDITPDAVPEIPVWLKNNAGWWVTDVITDKTYADALSYLIKHGIIVIGEYEEVPPITTSLDSILSTFETLSDETITMASNAQDPACDPNCFVPNIVNINIGDTVTFKNSKPSPTIIASGNPDLGPDDYFTSGPIGTNLSYSTTFNESGIYTYFDLVSPWMQGTINVGGIVNLPPTSNAGSNQSVDEDNIVILSGSGTDPENGLLTYTWKQISGTTVSLSGSSFPGGVSNGQSTFFTAPDVTISEILTFELKVKDDVAQSDTDTVFITVNNVIEIVNNSPTANAGNDASFVEGTIVTLDGSGSSDPDGDTITYKWTQTVGESTIIIADDILFDDTATNPQFTAPDVTADRNLQLKLIVTDSNGASSYDDRVTITITAIAETPSNNAPVAVSDVLYHLGSDAVTIDVLFNDYDADDDAITIQSVDTTGTAGTVTFNSTHVTFDPTDDVFGDTLFTYTITDGTDTDDANVLVTVIDNSGNDDAFIRVYGHQQIQQQSFIWQILGFFEIIFGSK